MRWHLLNSWMENMRVASYFKQNKNIVFKTGLLPQGFKDQTTCFVSSLGHFTTLQWNIGVRSFS